jgi:hypothetical protein
VDLFLTYSKYYRYRITAYNQAGVFGTTSLVSDALQPRQAGTNDIVADAITADLIASNAILANHIKAGEIQTTHLAAGSISLDTIASDYGWSDLPDDDGHKPEDDADVTLNNTAKDIINLPDTPSVAGLYANGTYLGYHDGSSWKAYIQNNGNFYFGGSSTNYIQWNGSTLTIRGSIVSSSVTSSTITGSLIDGTRLRVGGGTNEDIYFEDSGIRLYDSGSNQLYFYKSGLASLGLFFSNGVRWYTAGDFISINPGSYIFSFLDSGVMKFPSRTTAPSAYEGYHAFHKASGGAGDHLSFYDSYDTRWEHYHTESDW